MQDTIPLRTGRSHHLVSNLTPLVLPMRRGGQKGCACFSAPRTKEGSFLHFVSSNTGFEIPANIYHRP